MPRARRAGRGTLRGGVAAGTGAETREQRARVRAAPGRKGTTMTANPLVQLREQGQSVWYDNIRRGLITDGSLGAMIAARELTGVTSNPTIFEKAMGAGDEYDEQFRRLVRQGLGSDAIYEAMAIADIQATADLLRPVYDETGGADGYVSLEVSPHLGRDADATLDEARRLFGRVDRPNVMIKIPGTEEGAVAFEQAIAEGINVNVTLLFSLDAYESVARAYISGLERLVAGGKDPARVASVASFFVSRVDTLVDGLLQKQIDAGKPDARELLGKAAIANARLAYERFRRIFSEPRWQALAAEGARVQRPLWASTSTKNPAYRDVMYVEALIGPDTVNTMPPQTLDAVRDHGIIAPNTVTQGLDEARATLDALARLGIDMEAATDQLLEEGLASFSKSFEALLGAVEAKRRHLAAEEPQAQGAAAR